MEQQDRAARIQALLCEYRDMEDHNVLAYSANYAMTEPKPGFENEWNQACLKVKLLNEIIESIEHDSIIKSAMEREFRDLVAVPHRTVRILDENGKEMEIDDETRALLEQFHRFRKEKKRYRLVIQ